MMDPMYRKIPVTLCLVIASLLLTLLTYFGSNLQILSNLLISTTPGNLDAVAEREFWRLVTPAFVHFNIYHLVFNLLWVFVIGRVIELIDGSKFLLLMFVVAAVVSNLAEFYASGPLFGGMSGVVYAFFGYYWMQSMFNPIIYGRILPPAIIPLMLIWLIICWTGLIGEIANVAHTSGLIVGVVWGRINSLRLVGRD